MLQVSLLFCSTTMATRCGIPVSISEVVRRTGQHIIRKVAVNGVMQNSAGHRYFALANLWKMFRHGTFFPPSTLLRLRIDHRHRHRPLARRHMPAGDVGGEIQ